MAKRRAQLPVSRMLKIHDRRPAALCFWRPSRLPSEGSAEYLDRTRDPSVNETSHSLASCVQHPHSAAAWLTAGLLIAAVGCKQSSGSAAAAPPDVLVV